MMICLKCRNAITTATTLMLFALLGFIGWSVVNRSGIQYWGRRSTRDSCFEQEE